MELRTVESRASNEVRILIWNVHPGKSASHANKVIEALQWWDCDVLLLSEVDEAIQLPSKINRLGYAGMFVETRRVRGRGICAGNLIASRFTMHSPRIVPVRQGNGLISEMVRYYLEVAVQISDTYALTVGMAHKSQPIPFLRTVKEERVALLRETSKHTERYLFGGDMNELPIQRFIRALCRQLVHLGPSRLQLSRVPWRVDYAFGTKDLVPLIRQVCLGPRGPSDHCPILVCLEIEG